MSRIKRSINMCADFVLVPIKDNMVYFILWIVLLLIPDLWITSFVNYKEMVSYYVRIISLHVGFVYLGCCIIYLIKCCKLHLLSRILNYTISAILIVLSATDVFLYSFFKFSIGYESINLLLETNTTESKEFISEYIFSFDFLIIVLVYVLLIFIIFKLAKFILKIVSTNLFISVIVSVLIGISAINDIFCIKHYVGRDVLYDKNSVPSYITKTVMARIRVAQLKFELCNTYVPTCINTQKDIESSLKNPRIDNIVLIIGESHIKSHSSLYGYKLNTNPLLSKLGNLYIFNDVITSVNVTATAIKNMFLLSNVDDKYQGFEKPLLPAVCKKAGMNVIFYTNQFTKKGGNNFDFVGDFYMNNQQISDMMFTHRNTERYEYDAELIDDYVKNRGGMEKDSLNFIIFQLMGSHIQRKARYPEEFEYFTKDSIKRDGLDEQQKIDISHCDNSILYNDYIIDKIINLYKDKDAIIIYLSDHGDECHDLRKLDGRSSDYDSFDKKCAKYQLDIPFFVYLTERFNQKHPDIVKAVQSSVNRRYMTDDLPHLIIDLAGIQSKDYIPERSLINDSYNNSRNRRIVREDKIYNYDTGLYE